MKTIFSACMIYGLAWVAMAACAEDGKDNANQEPEIRFDVSYIHDNGEWSNIDHVYSADKKVLLKLDRLFGNRARLYDAKTGQPIGPEIKCDVGGACALAIATNNKTVAVGGAGGGGSVGVWDGTTGRLIGRWGHENEIASVKFSEDGKTLKVRSAHQWKS